MSDVNHTNKNDKSLPTWLLVSIFSVWIAVTLAGLWWFQSDKLKAFIDVDDDIAFYQPQSINRYLLPYLEQADLKQDQKLTQELAQKPTNQQTLLHFWRPDCLCNRVSQRHFTTLIREYTAAELRIVIIAHPNSDDESIEKLIELNGDRFVVIRAQDDLLNLPSSPALAIYDANNELSYFGPYGFGAFCNVREDGFLSSIIDDPKSKGFTNVIGDGCFCSWRN